MSVHRISDYMLIRRVARALDMHHDEVQRVLEETWDQIEDCLVHGKEVHIRSYWRFGLSWYSTKTPNCGKKRGKLIKGRYTLRIVPARRIKELLVNSEVSRIERIKRREEPRIQKER